MIDIVEQLRATAGWTAVSLAGEAADEIVRLRAENAALRQALHEVAEEWAGAECGEPVHAQEAYAISLAKRMYQIAADAINAVRKP